MRLHGDVVIEIILALARLPRFFRVRHATSSGAGGRLLLKIFITGKIRVGVKVIFPAVLVCRGAEIFRVEISGRAVTVLQILTEVFIVTKIRITGRPGIGVGKFIDGFRFREKLVVVERLDPARQIVST